MRYSLQSRVHWEVKPAADKLPGRNRSPAEGVPVKIAVIGTGYVGLVTSACLADSGNDVVGIDVDRRKIDLLNSGGVPIYEPGLQEMVERNRETGRLTFTTEYALGVPQARIIFVAVGTPESKSASREADLKYVWSAADQIAASIGAGPVTPGSKIVVVKSTVPVGTNQKVLERILAAGCRGVDVASNPEFLKEGAALDDFQKPDRVVVGVRRPEVAEALRELYAPFLRTENPFLVMSPESAETDQVRGQRHARHQDQLHQRGCQSLRPARSGRQRRAPRHRPRRPHRLPVPVPRPGLRRVVLPQGRARDHRHRAEGRHRAAADAGGGRRERAAKAGAAREDQGPLRRRAGGQDRRGLGPGLQAAHRRHPRGPGPDADRPNCWTPASLCASTTRRPAPTSRYG